MQWVKRHWLILLILLAALLLRLYRLPATLTFLEDEGRDLLVVKRMLDTGKPMLLGPQTSTGNMYLGPFYYYFITPALLLTGFNPVGPAVLVAVSGVVTVWLLYYLGQLWFSHNAGYVAALLYAVMPLPVVFTRNSWNPNLAPLIALLCTWLIVRLTTGHSTWKRDFLFLGLTLGMLAQLHYMALLFVAGSVLTLVWAFRRRLFQLLVGTLLALSAFAIVLSPFIVFEIRNNFVNTRAITRFIEAKEEPNIRYALPLWLWRDKVVSSGTRLLSSLYGRDALTPDTLRLPLTLAVSAILILAVVSRRRETPMRTILLLFVVPLAMLGIYQENVHLHYLGFFFPLGYLLFAAAPRSTLLAVPFVLYALPQLTGYLTSSDTHQMVRAQEVAGYITARAQGRSYNQVSAEGTPSAPYLYFTNLGANPPTTAPVDTLFLICEGEPCEDRDIHTPFIFITGPAHPTLAPYLGHPLYNYFEGEISLKNSEHVSHGAWVTELKIGQP